MKDPLIVLYKRGWKVFKRETEMRDWIQKRYKSNRRFWHRIYIGIPYKNIELHKKFIKFLKEAEK